MPDPTPTWAWRNLRLARSRRLAEEAEVIEGTRTVAINGKDFTVPFDELTDPNPHLSGGDCPWADSSTDAVCTLHRPHDNTVMHIAHDGNGSIVSMFDSAHGYRIP